MKSVITLPVLSAVIILRLAWSPAVPSAIAVTEDQIDKTAVQRAIDKFPSDLRDIAEKEILPKLERAEGPNARPVDKKEETRVFEKVMAEKSLLGGQLPGHPAAADRPTAEHVVAEHVVAERVVAERAAPPRIERVIEHYVAEHPTATALRPVEQANEESKLKKAAASTSTPKKKK